MEQGLKKTLKLPQLIALAAGGMIAAWMVEIQYWFSLTGTGSLLALILCAVFVLPLCFIYAEMTTMLPYAGKTETSTDSLLYISKAPVYS